jgi:uncharacterized membrane protein
MNKYVKNTILITGLAIAAMLLWATFSPLFTGLPTA